MTAPVPFTLTNPWLTATFPDLTNFGPLGQGGQKMVFAAKHAVDGDVVLKVVQPSVSVEEVRREILAVQTINSPRVPRVLDHGTTPTPLGDAYWIREQRIHGSTVRDILTSGPMTPPDVLAMARDVLGALVLAEAASIVHRDVKPDNIIAESGGNYWLIDFGLARHLSLASQTATAAPFGKMTYGYSPPEQFRNNKPAIDGRADLFALGVTIHECLTGANPFRVGATSPLEILQRVERTHLPPVVAAVSDPAELRDFVAALTQKRRDHRPASAREAQIWLAEICLREGI